MQLEDYVALVCAKLNFLPDLALVLFVPWICHIFTRSLVNSIKKSKNLQKGIDLLNSLQVLLRKPVIYSIIKRYVPSNVETRWGFLFKVAKLAVKNKDIINSIYINATNKSIFKYLKTRWFKIFHEGIPRIVEEICLVMLPIKCFFDKIEQTNAPLWCTKPLFKELKKYLTDIKGKLNILSNDCELTLNDFKNNYKKILERN